MKGKHLVLVFCLTVLTIFPGCQRNLTPNQNVPGKNPNISAAKDRADSFNGVVTSDTKAQTGMKGGTQISYTVPSGSTVRIVGRYDGYYVAVLPNGQMGLIPISSTRAASPSPTQAVTPAPPSGTTGQTNMVPGGTAPGGTTGGNTPSGRYGTPPAGDTTGGQNGRTAPGGVTGTNPGGTTAGTTGNELSTMINLINQARSNAGLNPLSSDASITNIANMKASDMAKNNYFSHNSPTYGSPFDMMKKYGVSYLYAGENLARDQNVQSAENALMNSPEHKANILNPNFTNIGIGIAQKSDGSKVYVQMFIGR